MCVCMLSVVHNLADVRLRVIVEHRGSHFIYPLRLLVLVTRYLCLCWIEADANSKMFLVSMKTMSFACGVDTFLL